jgi:ActR/RegA family two-component response regulator
MTAESEPQPRILVVDDVPANVRLLEAALEPAGFSLSSASSGRETVERVVTEPPDLVLLDVQNCAAAPPGQIVVSQRVLAEVEEIVEAESLGRLELKGFGKPVEAFAVSAAAPARV